MIFLETAIQSVFGASCLSIEAGDEEFKQVVPGEIRQIVEGDEDMV